jgi:hypothetical protein
LTQPNNWEYGPNGLPQVTGNLTINGHGATIQRATNAPAFRFFYVSGGLSYNSRSGNGLPAGTLNLVNLTLSGGFAAGGDGLGEAGGGAGMGGAVFNQGTLALTNVILVGNAARGGDCFTNGSGGGGGGMGSPATTVQGGGFGGCFLGVGGHGGNGATAGGGGGGGFRPGDAGWAATSKLAGDGGGLGLLATSGDGGNGGYPNVAAGGIGGGAYGVGGSGVGGNGGQSGGGGGIGGGGGHGGFNGADGSGGFGGGGGGGGEIGGSGGFGGGGGSGNEGSDGGFAAGNGNPEDQGGGGGGGLGGAIFNHRGCVTLVNCQLTGNSAEGGNGYDGGAVPLRYSSVAGSGYGGAIFNLNGTVQLGSTLMLSNSVVRGETTTFLMMGPNDFVMTNLPTGGADGGALYNLAFGNRIEDGSSSVATVSLTNSLFSGSIGGLNDLVNNAINGSQTNAANITYAANNLVMTSCDMTGAGCCSAAANALCSNTSAGNPLPTLTMVKVANQPVIYWPTNFSACTLQSSPDFSNPSAWTQVNCTPANLAGQFVVLDPPTGGSKFYRLVGP